MPIQVVGDALDPEHIAMVRPQPIVTQVACPLARLVGRPFAQESNSLSQLELIFDRQHCFFINYCGCI